MPLAPGRRRLATELAFAVVGTLEYIGRLDYLGFTLAQLSYFHENMRERERVKCYTSVLELMCHYSG